MFYIGSEGQRTSGEVFAVGSGSLFAYGVMDQGWKRDMSKEDACELARRSIYHATYRDAGSGGTAVVFHCGLDGKWEKVSGDDVTDLHH